MADKSVPTLFEWLGGMPALDRLTSRFYERVKDDPILAPIFAKMGGDHPHHVAVFLAEVLGGPAGYSEQFGGHPRAEGGTPRDANFFPRGTFFARRVKLAIVMFVKRSSSRHIT